MDSLQQFVKHLVPSLPDDLLQSFISILDVKAFSKNDIILNEGSIATNFYILGEGIVRSFYKDKDSKEHIITLYMPFSTTGSLNSLITKKPSKLIYECLTDCRMWFGNFDKFKELVSKNKELATLYISVLERLFLRTESKLIDLTILNGKERYLKLRRLIPNIDNLLPQYHIASYLNISPVQLSRIRKKLYEE